MADWDDFIFEFTLGNTHRIEFTVSLNEEDQDLASWARFRFTAKVNLKDPDSAAVIALTDASQAGIVRLDPGADPANLGKLQVTIPAVMTASLPNIRQALYADLQGTDADGAVWTLERGTLILLARVTFTVS